MCRAFARFARLSGFARLTAVQVCDHLSRTWSATCSVTLGNTSVTCKLRSYSAFNAFCRRTSPAHVESNSRMRSISSRCSAGGPSWGGNVTTWHRRHCRAGECMIHHMCTPLTHNVIPLPSAIHFVCEAGEDGASTAVPTRHRRLPSLRTQLASVAQHHGVLGNHEGRAVEVARGREGKDQWVRTCGGCLSSYMFRRPRILTRIFILATCIEITKCRISSATKRSPIWPVRAAAASPSLPHDAWPIFGLFRTS